MGIEQTAIAKNRAETDDGTTARKEKLSPERERLLRGVLAVMAVAAVDDEIRRRSEKLRSDRPPTGRVRAARVE